MFYSLLLIGICHFKGSFPMENKVEMFETKTIRGTIECKHMVCLLAGEEPYRRFL
jgi:hypothetical protein